MNEWVLLTGASQGIGVEFARWFAAKNYSLVMTARDEVRLQQLASELIARHQIKVKVLPKDLSQPSAPQEIFDELKAAGIDIAILVNNAGFGFTGPFANVDSRKHLDIIQVNITALTELTHLFLAPMLAKGSGKILNVASTAAFLPGPFMATYYASKAFVLSFSRALAEELSGTGVTVTTVCPGITRSEFHARAGLKRHNAFLTMNADEVVEIGCRALMAGKPLAVTGWKNRLGAFFLRRMPLGFITRMAAGFNR